MKTCYVFHVRVQGFWIVACNDHGHYRHVGRFGSHGAAVNAANAYNAKQRTTNYETDNL